MYIERNLETKQQCASLVDESMEDSWGPQSINTVEKACENRTVSRRSSVAERQGMVNL